VPPSSRDIGQAILGAAQAICGGATAGVGRFAIKVDGKPQNCRVSAGKAGEVRQLAIQIEAPAAAFKALPSLGMPEPLATRLGELLAAESFTVAVENSYVVVEV
jgi:hypothetical protein